MTLGVDGYASSLQGLNIKYCVCDKSKPEADEGIKLQVCDHNTKKATKRRRTKTS